tara:strand:- start:4643 stop:4975 length:333 start_codon:yes stop_codon:yes gene_type:complete
MIRFYLIKYYLSLDYIMASNFKVEKDSESGKFKIYNKKKASYSSRMFASKESATKMCSVYSNLGKKKAEPLVSEKLGKEVKEKLKKPRAVKVKKPRVKPVIDPALVNPSD